MTTNYSNILQAYLELFRTKYFSPKQSLDLESISIADAYRIQKEIIKKRVIQGEKIVGYKVGCTSAPIQAQFGLSNPIKGYLTQPHIFLNNNNLNASDFLNLAIEPEFVFKIGKDITKEFLENNEIEDAIDSVAPGIELHNYNFFFRPTSQELIILNGIHAGLVIGKEVAFEKKIDISLQGVAVFVNDSIVASAVGAEIMNSGPIKSLKWLANQLLEEGELLRAGDLVIPGSPVKLISLNPGDHVKVTITNFGTVEAFIE